MWHLRRGNMKTVLVTGGSGFIGSHLVKRLLNDGYKVVCLEKLNYSGDYNRLHSVLSEVENKSNLKVVYHDLRAEITNQIKDTDINYIVHMAAGTHVDKSIEDPLSFAYDNVIGTVNLLNFARTLTSLEHFIYFSTDEVFGPATIGVNFDEYDRFNSTNPYSASKAAAEEFCVAFNNAYNLPISITRTMNVFGEHQHPEKFIPLCISKIRKGETVSIHSDRTKSISGSRFYIHADDAVDGVVFILNRGYKPRNNVIKIPKYNIVGKVEVSNLVLAQLIAISLNKELKYEMVDFHSSRPGHDLRYALSGELMKSLGWEPKVSLHDRITQVVDWYVKN